MKSPDKVGQQTEGVVLAEFLKRGFTVLTPFGYSHRYDFALDVGGVFYRIQCKTGRVRNGAVTFNSCSMNNVTREKRDYRGQIEFFAVLEPESGKVYLVPPDRVGKREGYLRFVYPTTGQKKTIVLAENFEIEKFFGA